MRAARHSDGYQTPQAQFHPEFVMLVTRASQLIGYPHPHGKQMMSESKQSRIRHWHPRLVILPRKLKVEGVGREWVFLRTLEARWSQSRRRWQWRLP